MDDCKSQTQVHPGESINSVTPPRNNHKQISDILSRRMEKGQKSDLESEYQVPDNSKVQGLDTSGFEGTVDSLQQLMKSMEVLLSDVEQLRSNCSHQATELMRAAVDLRQQQDELKESYSELSREMQEIMDSVDDLFTTKSAFEAKEKQVQKLNRQL
ncbi:hypothetical protein JOB18_033223 [Solea senegalensis]|uniref:Uncharacterized protein n=2 Tax=Solea senegalensis TaxID=28829 RepID=A0AAV6RUI1_SOLSE|nr:hypothetical protein JOB18_033223 [Solea senegalensis]